MGPKLANNPQRTPIVDARLGQIDAVPTSPPIEGPPYVDKYGLCPKPTNAAEAPTHGGSMMVRSNYVRVNKIPKTLHVYSVTFFRTTDKGLRFEYNKGREIHDAFDSLIDKDVLKLKENNVTYVHDFKSLWTTTPIHDILGVGDKFLSDEFAYAQQNGKQIPNMQAELTVGKLLGDIEEALHKQHIRDLPEYIRALNANVAQCIVAHSKETGNQISRVGANKYYVSNGYVEMDGKLRAGHSYYTSIRPGSDDILLNINPATSAFLPPVTVSDFIKRIGSDKLVYVGQLLQGATLKIRYRRSNYQGSDVDYNSEEARLKIFTQIGPYTASLQKFYELEDKVDGQPRTTRATDHGTTVYDYFVNTARVQFPAGTTATSPEMFCINIGKRVRTVRERVGIEHNTNPDDQLMRGQSAEGAQWIPAYLLQIVPDQVVKTTLNNKHTSQMIRHTLRLPAENLGLLEKEGLDMMGVKPGSNGQQPLASMGFAVDEELIEVPATQLPPPKLSYGQYSPPKSIKLGSWDVQGVEFHTPAPHLKQLWMLAMPNSYNGTMDELAGIYSDLFTVFKAHSLQFEEGVRTEQVCDRESLFKAKDQVKRLEYSDKDVMRKFMNTKCYHGGDCGFILIPEKSYDTYAMAKRIADFGGRNIFFVVGSKIAKPKAGQLMSNLALKVNIRFGGDNHHFDPMELNSILSLQTRNNTIFMGADIAHCGAGGKEGSPSIACVVGSVDSDFVRYPGSMRL